MAAPMSLDEIAKLAASVGQVLDDPTGGLDPLRRRRWDGALAALKAVLGDRSSLVDNFGLGFGRQRSTSVYAGWRRCQHPHGHGYGHPREDQKQGSLAVRRLCVPERQQVVVDWRRGGGKRPLVEIDEVGLRSPR